MVFVHARNATVRTAMTLREKAKNNGTIGLFQSKQSSDYGTAEKQVQAIRLRSRITRKVAHTFQ
jgi:activating signal cointegrator complex subunit 3